MKSKKPTYRDIELQIRQLAKIISQLSNLYMIMESDVKDIREALTEAKILKTPEAPEASAPESANVEDYFPKKEDESVQSV